MTSDQETVPSPAPGASRWRLAISFVLILAGINLLYYAEKKLALGIWDQPYTRLVTWTAGQVAALVLPYPIRAGGVAIVAEGRTTLIIVSGCNGLEAIFLIVAGILAYPATWRQRWLGLARYVPALYMLNLLRVVFLVHIAHRHPTLMDISHFQVAQGILIVFVLFFWIHYIRRTDQ